MKEADKVEDTGRDGECHASIGGVLIRIRMVKPIVTFVKKWERGTYDNGANVAVDWCS